MSEETLKNLIKHCQDEKEKLEIQIEHFQGLIEKNKKNLK